MKTPMSTETRIRVLEGRVRQLEEFITKGLNHYEDVAMGKAVMLMQETLESTILDVVESSLYISADRDEYDTDNITYSLRRN
jgi:hypothetical protein